MDNTDFPRGVELVCSAIIESADGKILLGQSPKWSNKWVFPGGHVEPGESFKEAVKREAKEEMGIDIEPSDWFVAGELINSLDFHRLGHFVYFDILCFAKNKNIELDQREITDYMWVNPIEALNMDLAEGYSEVIKKYLEYKKQ